MSKSKPDARAFWVVAPGRGEIRDEILNDAGPGEVRVRTLYTAVSRGTEALVFNAAVPASEFERMRAPFQTGAFPFPVKYGYINVGVVEQGPAELQGRRVFCLYPHQTRYVVPAAAVHPIPDAVPPARAVLAANLETAVNGFWDASPRIGDRVAVVGAGVVGCLTAWLAARIPGCAVELIDVQPDRSRIAAALKVPFATPDTAAGDADVVVHASATEAGLATALRLAGTEATVVELSWFGNRSPAVPLGEAFHSRRLTLRSSQVGHLPAAQRSRWDHRRRMQLVLEMLAEPVLDALISGESPFDDLPAIMPGLAASSGQTLCHRIAY